MAIAGEGHYTTFESNFGDWRAGENQCGLWIAGHHSSDYYIEALFGELKELDYDKAKIEPLVTQAYLQKIGNNLFFKDTVEDEYLPITTVFSPELNAAISDLY